MCSPGRCPILCPLWNRRGTPGAVPVDGRTVRGLLCSSSMREIIVMALVCAVAACDDEGAESRVEQALTPSVVAPVNQGNALTLPAQRHLVRLTPASGPRWLLALQQDGADGRMLGFYRSDDEART